MRLGDAILLVIYIIIMLYFLYLIYDMFSNVVVTLVKKGLRRKSDRERFMICIGIILFYSIIVYTGLSDLIRIFSK